MTSNPEPNLSELSRRIKNEAQRLGFELVGISPVRVPPHELRVDRVVAIEQVLDLGDAFFDVAPDVLARVDHERAAVHQLVVGGVVLDAGGVGQDAPLGPVGALVDEAPPVADHQGAAVRRDRIVEDGGELDAQLAAIADAEAA